MTELINKTNITKLCLEYKNKCLNIFCIEIWHCIEIVLWILYLQRSNSRIFSINVINKINPRTIRWPVATDIIENRFPLSMSQPDAQCNSFWTRYYYCFYNITPKYLYEVRDMNIYRKINTNVFHKQFSSRSQSLAFSK